jgi:RNA polymerase sigma factor (sigma-70 family)
MFDLIPGVDESSLDPIFVERIKDAVENLPEDERTVVECLVWGSMTKVEVAEMLGRSRQSVHDVYKRAVVSLRAELATLAEELGFE